MKSGVLSGAPFCLGADTSLIYLSGQLPKAINRRVIVVDDKISEIDYGVVSADWYNGTVVDNESLRL